MSQQQIDIVVPDGSMQDVIGGMLAKAGLSVTMEKRRTKQGRVTGVDWIKRVVFQRPQEIPHYLKNGHFDIGIVGEDWIANWGYEFPVLLKLPIGRSGQCSIRLVLVVSQDSPCQKPEDLPQGCEVATEYVQLVQRHFTGLGRGDIKVVPSFGNTEHKIGFGATAIVDVTESGNSLEENRLRIIGQLMESNTVIVANAESLADVSKRPCIDCFVRLIHGAYQASKHVLLIANVPEAVLERAAQIIGGLKGPARTQLMGRSDWFALESFVPREREQTIIFDLLQIGVVDIAVIRDIPLIMS